MDLRTLFYFLVACIVIAIQIILPVFSWRYTDRYHKTVEYEAKHQQIYDEIMVEWRMLQADTRLLKNQYLHAKTTDDNGQKRDIKREALPYIEFCEEFLKTIQRVINQDHAALERFPQANVELICRTRHKEWDQIQRMVNVFMVTAKDIYENEMSKGW